MPKPNPVKEIDERGQFYQAAEAAGWGCIYEEDRGTIEDCRKALRNPPYF